MSFWRRSLGSAFIMVLQAVFTRGIGIISSGILARLLSPSEWGALQAIMHTAGAMAQSLKLSVDTGLQVRLSETEQKADAPTAGEFLGGALLLLAAMCIIAVSLGLFSSEAAAKLFGAPELAPYMVWAGLLTAGQLLSQINAALIAFGAFRLVALIQVGVNSVYLALLVGAYFMHVRGIWLGLSTQLFLQLGIGVAFLVFTVRAWRARGIRPTLNRVGQSQRELLRLGLPMHAAAAVPALLSLFVSANLARTTGLPALADLRVVGTMSQLVSFLPASMAVSFVTEFAGARGSDARVSHRDFLRYIRLILAGALIAATTAAWTAPWLVPLTFGVKYSSAVKLVSIGVATAIVNATKQAMLVGMISERRTGYALIDSLLSSLVYALLAALLTPAYGVTGMLFAELSGQLITLLVLSALLSDRFRQSDTTKPAIQALLTLALALAALIATFATHEQPSATQVTTPILIALTLATPWLLFASEERSFLRQVLSARWKRF